jgi:deoxyribose-phosphate aldolase
MSVPDPEALETALRRLHEKASSSAAGYVDEALDAVSAPTSPGLAGPEELPPLTPSAVAGAIDHTQLRPAATDTQIDQLCEEARTHNFTSVCVHPTFVPRVVRRLEEVDVTACTVVGFPHGANRTSTKAQEARRAVMDGARELDMVLALGAVTSGRYSDAEADVRGVVTAAREQADAVGTPVPVKVILETALLTPAQTAVACVIARRAGADFVKTSTGFASTGARAEDVALMRQVVGAELGVKASGGVGSVADVERMMAHGATRIGASGSVAIMEELQSSAESS